MFQENFKALRKQKGFTQEALAIQLHVVRQTVSKWEKGLSVPDAEMLQRIAEVLEVDVGQLLGGELPKGAAEQNAVAEQLARINEQLAVRNRRARRVWRTVGIALIALLLASVTVTLLGVVRVGGVEKSAGRTAWTCELDGEEYGYEIEYNGQYRILSSTVTSVGEGSASETADLESIGDANRFAARLEAWFTDLGGTVTVTEEEGLALSGR